MAGTPLSSNPEAESVETEAQGTTLHGKQVLHVSPKPHLFLNLCEEMDRNRLASLVTEAMNTLAGSVFYASISSPLVSDVIFVGLMALSSGYMVTFLCKHKKKSQVLHSTSLSLKPSAEQRATQTILYLMSFFVVMYTLDSINAYLRNTSALSICLICCSVTTALTHFQV
ncbi:hypothetical protein A6R68_12919 [Neotoma lepida]|uniref:Vomeronasal type-1 receptor n=1 Tax=Neotoma lepida TaxID=56216 RepID=A0A1A6H2B0_NEOLE|nr:hypothetical protein A6R68_12919 [Neotoma lepida]